MSESYELSHRIPSRASVRLARGARLTIWPLSHVLPVTAVEARALRRVIELGSRAAGLDKIEHHPVRAGFGERQVRGEWVGELPQPGQRIVYYLHGSAYAFCSPRTHRDLVRRLARRTGRAAFSLDYRLGPRHRFPSAHDDAVNGYRWLLEQGHRPEDILVAGDSAGGHLSLSLCGELRRLGIPMPSGLVLLSPLVDGSFDTAAAARVRTSDPTVHPRFARRIIRHYLHTGDMADPRFNVALEAGPDLPPTLLIAGGREMMAADSELFAGLQVEAGGQCELQVWPGQLHVFPIFSFLPEASAALDEITRFVDALDQQRDAAAS